MITMFAALAAPKQYRTITKVVLWIIALVVFGGIMFTGTTERYAEKEQQIRAENTAENIKDAATAKAEWTVSRGVIIQASIASTNYGVDYQAIIELQNSAYTINRAIPAGDADKHGLMDIWDCTPINNDGFCSRGRARVIDPQSNEHPWDSTLADLEDNDDYSDIMLDGVPAFFGAMFHRQNALIFLVVGGLLIGYHQLRQRRHKAWRKLDLQPVMRQRHVA